MGSHGASGDERSFGLNLTAGRGAFAEATELRRGGEGGSLRLEETRGLMLGPLPRDARGRPVFGAGAAGAGPLSHSPAVALARRQAAPEAACEDRLVPGAMEGAFAAELNARFGPAYSCESVAAAGYCSYWFCSEGGLHHGGADGRNGAGGLGDGQDGGGVPHAHGCPYAGLCDKSCGFCPAAAAAGAFPSGGALGEAFGTGPLASWARTQLTATVSYGSVWLAPHLSAGLAVVYSDPETDPAAAAAAVDGDPATSPEALGVGEPGAFGGLSSDEAPGVDEPWGLPPHRSRTVGPAAVPLPTMVPGAGCPSGANSVLCGVRFLPVPPLSLYIYTSLLLAADPPALFHHPPPAAA